MCVCVRDFRCMWSFFQRSLRPKTPSCVTDLRSGLTLASFYKKLNIKVRSQTQVFHGMKSCSID